MIDKIKALIEQPELIQAEIDKRKDNLNASAWEKLGKANAIRLNTLQKEKVRLSTKFGVATPRVFHIDKKIVKLKAAATTIDLEAKRAKFIPKKPSEGKFMIHGRLIEGNKSPSKELTVKIVDDNNKSIMKNMKVKADKEGYFAVELDPKDKAILAKESFTLLVVDSQKKEIIKERVKHKAMANKKIYKEFLLR